MKIDDFTFERRPLSELPSDDLSQWLADFNGDDQWYQGSPVNQAAVIRGNRIIIWQDDPLTEEDKRSAIAEYEETMEAEATRDEDGCYAEDRDAEDAAYNWNEEGF